MPVANSCHSWGLRMPRALGGRLISLLIFSLLLTACGGEEDTPESQVRRYLTEAEAVVEARKISAVRGLISERYSDRAKRTRRDLLRLIGGYFFRHKSIHLFTKVDHLQIREEGQAEVVLYVAMAGSPIEGIEQLPAIRADLHRFELELGQDEAGEWRLLSAGWRRATLEDFAPAEP